MTAEAVAFPAQQPGVAHVTAPTLPDLPDGSGPAADMRDVRLLAGVEVQVDVVLGRVKLPLGELLALSPGSVLELNRAADAPVEVLVNGTLVACGEVVIVGDELGVRITSVVESR